MINPKDVTCYIPIEIKARELDAKLYLALRLAEKNFSVVIGRKTNVHKKMFSEKKPFIYFDKGISTNHWNFYNAIKASNGLMVEIQEEGNISIDTFRLTLVHNSRCAQLFSLIFLWGKYQEKIIKNTCLKLDSSVLKVTGFPSLDLVNKDLIDYYIKLVKKNQKIDKDYILINTNFGYYNSHITFDESKQINGGLKELYDEKKREEWEDFRKFQSKVFYEFLKMIKTLSKSFDQKKIIVRPHPTEKIETYQKEFEKYENIKITREGSVREWIIGAECVIHHDCTTGIESFIAGKNVVSYCPFYDEEKIVKLPVDISVKIESLDKLINYIKQEYQDKDLSSTEIRQKKILYLENYIANLNKSATSEIVENLEELCQNWKNPRVVFTKKAYYLFILKFFNLVKNIKDNSKNIIFNTKNIENLAKSKFPYLNKCEVEDRFNIWYKHLSIIKKLKISEIKKDIFFISK